jgi:hypothetical protein
MQHGKLSRRSFLRLTAGSATGVAIIAACAPAGAPTGGDAPAQEAAGVAPAAAAGNVPR